MTHSDVTRQEKKEAKDNRIITIFRAPFERKMRQGRDVGAIVRGVAVCVVREENCCAGRIGEERSGGGVARWAIVSWSPSMVPDRLLGGTALGGNRGATWEGSVGGVMCVPRLDLTPEAPDHHRVVAGQDNKSHSLMKEKKKMRRVLGVLIINIVAVIKHK